MQLRLEMRCESLELRACDRAVRDEVEARVTEGDRAGWRRRGCDDPRSDWARRAHRKQQVEGTGEAECDGHEHAAPRRRHEQECGDELDRAQARPSPPVLGKIT